MARSLTPGEIARRLFGIDPDRDEKASQLCVETLLTLANNGYEAPGVADDLVSPKTRRYAVRSLALSQNFLAACEAGRIGRQELSPQGYGEILARGDDLQGSANLNLARESLQGLIDPSTHQGQPGGWLLRPFHESLLWYDARQERERPWRVRQVYMRGSGVTLARMLAAPPETAGTEVRSSGKRAVDAIRSALTVSSPLAEIAEGLERALPDDLRGSPTSERGEVEAWRRGDSAELAGLAGRICRHAEGVMLQGTASAPAKLWQLRTVLALDLAVHALETSWNRLSTPRDERFLLLTFGGPPRRDNRVRQLSERSYNEAKRQMRLATVATLASEMQSMAASSPSWEDELENRRGRLSAVIDALKRTDGSTAAEEFERLARLATDTADYGRAAEGFRVLLDTIGMLAGTGSYKYLTATPELFAALVGALSAEMPMTATDFFAALRREWNVVIDQSAGTKLALELDGADLQRGARRAELRLAEAGLGLALSDRTMVVGERAQRSA